MDLRQGFIQKFDWMLFLPVFLLGAIGLVAIYSTDLGEVTADFANFKKQLLTFAVGIFFVFVIATLNYRQLKNGKNLLYFIGFLLLAGVLIFGKNIRGTTGWFYLGPFSFQPVEIIKIILVIFLADYFAREGRRLFSFWDIIKSLIAVAIFIALVLYQPDLGSSIILFLAWAGMLIVSRVRKKHLIIILFAFFAVSLVSWFFILKDFQKDRISVFTNPELDPLGAGYNIKQSIIAIGSGGIFGKGLGFGSQSQLRFLPEAHTDFIFALIAEEMGFVMVFFIIGLYTLFFYRILKIAKDSKNDFNAYVAIGFLVVFLCETLINIGMNIGLMPVTGIALPFISLGGSSLISSFIMVGILESMRVRS